MSALDCINHFNSCNPHGLLNNPNDSADWLGEIASIALGSLSGILVTGVAAPLARGRSGVKGKNALLGTAVGTAAGVLAGYGVYNGLATGSMDVGYFGKAAVAGIVFLRLAQPVRNTFGFMFSKMHLPSRYGMALGLVMAAGMADFTTNYAIRSVQEEHLVSLQNAGSGVALDVAKLAGAGRDLLGEAFMGAVDYGVEYTGRHTSPSPSSAPQPAAPPPPPRSPTSP